MDNSIVFRYATILSPGIDLGKPEPFVTISKSINRKGTHMYTRPMTAIVGLLAMLMCLAMAPVNTTCPMSVGHDRQCRLDHEWG